MTSSRESKNGRVRLAAIFLVFCLIGLAWLGGWWYGRLPKIEEKVGQAKPESPPPPELKLAPRESSGGGESMILEDRLADVAAKAMPSVVNVFTEKTVRVQASPFAADPFFRQFFGPGVREVPRERRERALGSGVIVTADGYILTNNHVVTGADSVMVALADKREFPAKVVGADPETDVAVLKIEADKLPALPLGDSDKVRVGQVVLAIGNPFGLSQTVTMGIISARGRSQIGITDYEDFLQTDAAVNPGNSGGALINLSAELIGINTAIFSRTGNNNGIGFAIPANLAANIMKSLVTTGAVTRGFLGVSIQDLSPALAQQFGLGEPAGALVNDVIKGGPAEQAGIKPGDVVLSIEGKAVTGPGDLRNRIAALNPGAQVQLEIVRDGQKMTIAATLGERPAADHENPGPAGESPPESGGEAELAGMKVTALTPDLADRLGIPGDTPGVVVVDIKGGSRSDSAGVMIGDLIVTLNQRPVQSLSDFRAAANPAGNGPILLKVRRQGQSLFIAIPKS